MKQKIIDSYILCGGYVQVVLREGTGGEFYSAPEHGHVPRIKVGTEYGAWPEVVAVLIHEALEYVLVIKGRRFEPCSDLAKDHSSYLFLLNHSQFSDACAELAAFLTVCLPDVAKAWKDWKS